MQWESSDFSQVQKWKKGSFCLAWVGCSLLDQGKLARFVVGKELVSYDHSQADIPEQLRVNREDQQGKSQGRLVPLWSMITKTNEMSALCGNPVFPNQLVVQFPEITVPLAILVPNIWPSCLHPCPFSSIPIPLVRKLTTHPEKSPSCFRQKPFPLYTQSTKSSASSVSDVFP